MLSETRSTEESSPDDRILALIDLLDRRLSCRRSTTLRRRSSTSVSLPAFASRADFYSKALLPRHVLPFDPLALALVRLGRSRNRLGRHRPPRPTGLLAAPLARRWDALQTAAAASVPLGTGTDGFSQSTRRRLSDREEVAEPHRTQQVGCCRRFNTRSGVFGGILSRKVIVVVVVGVS